MNVDPIAQFRDAIVSAGLTAPDTIEADGALHRFAANGKRDDDAGYYVLHNDGIPAGYFGDWRSGLSQTWRADVGRKLTPAEDAAHRAKVDAMRREREAETARRQVDAANRAAAILAAAQPAPDDHPYLTRKGIKANGARLHDGALVIPMRDTDGALHSLQFIGPDGIKRFLTGGRVKGCYFLIGTPGGRTCIAEGFATGASIHEATGHAVAVAFNRDNLLAVAQGIRAKDRAATLILCADDDVQTAGNPGLTAATAAAQSVGGLLAVPDFGSDRPAGVNDFNDLAQLRGADAIERAVANATGQDDGMHREHDGGAPGDDTRGRDAAHESTPETEAREWPAPLDLEVLAERDPIAPRSIMEGVPCGYATGTFGHGGTGKSQIELLRAVCIAAGVPFCGLETERRRVLFISCEDRADILHWRLTRICAYLGINLASLRGWLHVVDLVGRDSILFAPDSRTGHALTMAYGILAERMREYAGEVLVLDGITDTFGGNENARGDVKHFVNMLLALIPADTGALILIGHVNKATAASGTTGEGYSGSTAWHNSARARWYLYPETAQGDDGERSERTGRLIFELQKSNHGEVGAQIEFEWDPEAHLFVGRAKGGTTEFDRRHRDRTERRGILQALQACATSDPAIIVPAATTGQRTAFHVLSARPEIPDSMRTGKAGVRRFWRQIEALRQMHAIEEAAYRRTNRHVAAQIVLTTEGVRQCAEC